MMILNAGKPSDTTILMSPTIMTTYISGNTMTELIGPQGWTRLKCPTTTGMPASQAPTDTARKTRRKRCTACRARQASGDL